MEGQQAHGANHKEAGMLTLPDIEVAVYPGGSGIVLALGLTGGELRSITHRGGGGGTSIFKTTSCFGLKEIEMMMATRFTAQE